MADWLHCGHLVLHHWLGVVCQHGVWWGKALSFLSCSLKNLVPRRYLIKLLMPFTFPLTTEAESATAAATVLPPAELLSDEKDTQVHQENSARDCQVSNSLCFITMVMLQSSGCLFFLTPLSVCDQWELQDKGYYKCNRGRNNNLRDQIVWGVAFKTLPWQWLTWINFSQS